MLVERAQDWQRLSGAHALDYLFACKPCAKSCTSKQVEYASQSHWHIKVAPLPNCKLWDLRVFPHQHVARVLQDLGIGLVWLLLQCCYERPAHGT